MRQNSQNRNSVVSVLSTVDCGLVQDTGLFHRVTERRSVGTRRVRFAMAEAIAHPAHGHLPAALMPAVRILADMPASLPVPCAAGKPASKPAGGTGYPYSWQEQPAGSQQAVLRAALTLSRLSRV